MRPTRLSNLAVVLTAGLLMLFATPGLDAQSRCCKTPVTVVKVVPKPAKAATCETCDPCGWICRILCGKVCCQPCRRVCGGCEPKRSILL